MTVVDTGTLKPLGSIEIGRAKPGTPIFTPDGKSLCLGTDQGYVSWSYANGQMEPLRATPTAAPTDYWNYDRTIAIAPPTRESQPQKRAETRLPGEVVLADGVVYSIPATARFGFDQVGSAWFTERGSWTMVGRDGRVRRQLAKPPALMQDQSRDRGLLHLTDSRTTLKFRDAKCFLTSIWLYHDRPRPARPELKPDRAAVAFAGPDVLTYGFLPGKNLIYVVSAFGSYLVPFQLKKSN